MSAELREEKARPASAMNTTSAPSTLSQPSVVSPQDTPRTQSKRETFAMALVRDARLLLIALWLGAAVFFSFAVAPSAFGVLPTRELAGAVVGRTLTIVNISGFIISLLLLATLPIVKNRLSRRAAWVEAVALIVIAGATAVGHWIIAARLTALRARMGRPIDEIAQNDPLRIAFGSLHGYSVIALCVGMIAAMVALLLIARRTNAVSSPGSQAVKS